MNFLSIFLEDFRGSRKTVFRLKIMNFKGAGNDGILWAKSTNFRGLVFIPNIEILLLWDLKITNHVLGSHRMEDQGVQSSQTFLMKKFSFFQLLCTFKCVLNTSTRTDCGFKAASWT